MDLTTQRPLGLFITDVSEKRVNAHSEGAPKRLGLEHGTD